MIRLRAGAAVLDDYPLYSAFYTQALDSIPGYVN